MRRPKLEKIESTHFTDALSMEHPQSRRTGPKSSMSKWQEYFSNNDDNDDGIRFWRGVYHHACNFPTVTRSYFICNRQCERE